VTAANRIRRTVRGGVLVGVPLLILLASPWQHRTAMAAGTAEPPNLLDRPMADLAILPATEPGASGATTPFLLVLEAGSPTPSTARLDLLRRDNSWLPMASADIDLAGEGLDDRWLIGLGDRRFVLVATTPQTTVGTGRALVVAFDVDPGPGAPAITEVGRQSFDRAIEEAGAADVDGFGAAELVLGMRWLAGVNGSCGTTSLVVLDGSVASIRRMVDLPGRLAAGVVGRFDGLPGDDLLVYSSFDCPPGGETATRLLTIRLADGTDTPIDRSIPGDPGVYPQPLRVDLDGRAPDEVIAVNLDGLLALDPGNGWRKMLLGPIGSIPLLAAPTDQKGLPGTRVAMLNSAGAGSLVTARLGRGPDGKMTWDGRSDVPADAVDQARWMVLTIAMQEAAMHQSPSGAWLGDAVAAGCPDLVLPGAILPCGTDDVRPGAAWLATRPVGAMDIAGQRVVLIAAGLGWDPATGLPASPTPEAAGPPGWWRHGPSTPFALSEARSADLAYFRDFPIPAATIESTTAKDGSTALPGFTGARLFAAITPLREGEDGGPGAANSLDALTTGPRPGGRTDVVRVPVPPGLESGRDGSFARLTIGDLRGIDGQPTNRWAMQVVAINDWGEWSQPAASVITRDATGPTVAVEDPFTSPIWPFYARLDGRSEPGSTVRVDGFGDLEVDRRGRFTIETQLAPWPQVYRVTATDPAGNVTVSEVSVIGGVDYRRFPWPGIVAAALLALVAARGLFGGGRGRSASVEATRWSTGAFDEASTPEIEELPPGSGLARG
jgi:hypothetical protein